MEEAVKDDLKHFSHLHPLEYCARGRGYTASASASASTSCFACTLPLPPNKFFYTCKLCPFSLHKVCYTMPENVMHPAHLNHHLTLLPSPSTACHPPPLCHACGAPIPGFCYTCSKCSCYYHILCLAMPLSLKIPSSHPHILELELKPPYDFQCDLCDRPRYNTGWLYRCRICEFDAHVSCALTFKDGLHITSFPYDTVRAPPESTSHVNELMELLSEGMKGGIIQAKNGRILDDDQFQSLDQSILISENFSLPSCHFSDASCFSIDIANSIRTEDKTANEAGREACSDHWAQLQESKKTVKDQTVVDSNEKLRVAVAGQRHCHSFNKGYLKRELSLAPSIGIHSHVWEDLGQVSKKTSNRMPFKDQATKTENTNSRRTFWSKLLTCF